MPDHDRTAKVPAAASAYRARANFLPGLHLFHRARRDRVALRRERRPPRRNSSTARSSRRPTPVTSSPTPEGCVLDANARIHSPQRPRDARRHHRGRHPFEWTAPRRPHCAWARPSTSCLALGEPLRDHGDQASSMRADGVAARGNERHGRSPPSRARACFALCHDITSSRPDAPGTRRQPITTSNSRVAHRTAELARANAQHPVPRAPAGIRRRPGPPRAGRVRTSTNSCARPPKPSATWCSTWNFCGVVEHADPGERSRSCLRAIQRLADAPQHAWPNRSPPPTPRFITGYHPERAPCRWWSRRLRKPRTRFPACRRAWTRAWRGQQHQPVAIGGDPQPFGVIGAHSRQTAPVHVRTTFIFVQSHRQRAGRRHRAQAFGGNRCAWRSREPSARTTRRSNSSRA